MGSKPIRSTVWLGAMAGLVMAGALLLIAPFLGWTLTVNLTLAAVFVAYGRLLLHQADRGPGAALLAGAILVAVALTGRTAGYLALLLGMLSWLRSGVCFPGPVLPKAMAELALCLGGAALVAIFGPRTPLAWGLGVWLFFLVQSLYFVAQSDGRASRDHGGDPFEAARRRAERLLAED